MVRLKGSPRPGSFYSWLACWVVFTAPLSAQIPAGSIGTVAGTGTNGYTTGAGVASAAQIEIAYGVAVDALGNIYIADTWNHRIRKVTPNGSIKDFAGTGTPGFSGDNGPATSAKLSFPRGLAVDSQGNVFVSDSGNNLVRKIQADGVIKTVAGNQQAGNQGDGGAATLASLRVPRGLAVDTQGNLYIADSFNARIRKVGADGKISTFAGTGQFSKSGDGGPATSANIGFVHALAFDANGNLYFTDTYNHCIRRIRLNGIIETVAGTGQAGFAGDNQAAVLATLNLPRGLALIQSGIIYVADSGNHRIRRIAADGSISTVAGTGVAGFGGDSGAAALALLNSPYHIATDLGGNVYVNDSLNYRVRQARFGTLPAGSCSYSLNLRGQAFPAQGGTGTIVITAGSQCLWAVSSDLAWVTFPSSMSGSGNGAVDFRVIANPGATRSGNLTIAGLSYSVEQQGAAGFGPALSFAGSMAHMAAAGGWGTTITLVNSSAAAASARLGFFDNSGNPLALPLTFPQGSSSAGALLAATLDGTLAPNSTLIVGASGPLSDSVKIGSIQLSTSGGIDAYNTFRSNSNGQEAVVPLETRNAGAYWLAFDNTSGLVTGVAIANLTPNAATIPVVIRDDTGAVIRSSSVALPGQGHSSFGLTELFAVTANKRGAIEFDTPAGGRIGVIGLRFTPSGAFTTIPVLANVTAGFGSMAHLASAGGWATTITLVNTSATAAQAHLRFFDNSGKPLSLSLSFPQSNTGSTIASTLDRTVGPNSTLVIDSTGPPGDPVRIGSIQLNTDGSISAFNTFRSNFNGQEAVVPLETRNAGSYLLAFDNTGGLVTGVAIANVTSNAVTIPVVIRDDTGAVISSTTVALASQGHNSFALADFFGVTANKRGTVEFDTPAGGQISVLGLRFTPTGAFTTIPVIAK